MSDTRTGLRPGPNLRSVRDADGAVVPVPAGWELLPPGDAAVTRAVKAAGPTWTVEERKGRKVFSRGVWAPAANIARARADVAEQREDPAHQRKLEASRRRRAVEQAAYVGEFEAAVLAFLRFHPRHAEVAAELARRVTAHATPVGSGTVARTERIPVERRAESAVIAWMRHQTTAYDDMVIVRVQGARREVRQELAAASRALLQRYRRGEDPDADCPLARALREPAAAAATAAPPPRPTAAPAPPGPRPVAPRGAAPRLPDAPLATARAPLPRPSGDRAPAALPRTHGDRAPAPETPAPPPAAPGTLPEPRNAHEEAQRALYERVRARLTRGR